MKILEIKLHDVELPLKHSFETSSHRKSSLRHLVVEMLGQDDAGERWTGWGEIASPAGPYYASETTTSAWHIASTYLIPAALKHTWDRPDQFQEAYSNVRGHWFAKAGIEMAAWTLYSAAKHQSLADSLGATRKTVVAGVSLGIESSIEELLVQVEKHVASGYPRVKLKVAPGWDVEPVKAVRAAYPDLDVHVDANGAYPFNENSMAIFAELDQYSLTMIEQPFAPRDFLAHAALTAQIATPVCLDESVETIEDLHTALALKAGNVLNIKVSRMGGLTAAKRAHDIASEAGWPVWCGGMHEFGIGRLANVAISALPGFTLPSDVSASEKYYAEDIITPAVTALDGVVEVPQGPGLGHQVRPEIIAKYATRSETFAL